LSVRIQPSKSKLLALISFWTSGAGWGVALHMSLGLGQTSSLEPVVEAALDVGVRAFAAADSVKLLVKPPGCSVPLSWPRALLCSWISCSNWYVLSYCLHECCRCEL